MISLEGILFTNDFFYSPIEVVQIKLSKKEIVEEEDVKQCMISSDEEENNKEEVDFSELIIENDEEL